MLNPYINYRIAMELKKLAEKGIAKRRSSLNKSMGGG